MNTHDVLLRSQGRRDHTARLPATPAPETGSRRVRRMRCADVARNRAGRYSRRHPRAKRFLPLISTAIFAALMLERWPEAFSFRKKSLPRPDKAGPLPATEDDGRQAAHIWADDDRAPQFRPSPDFLAKDVAQVVAFLVRNRGRLDTEAVRAKWDFLDRVSLPLAVYLREVEAIGAWDVLENDIKVAPMPGSYCPDAMPRSLWHRKVLAALPDWSKRGESLIRGASAEGLSPELAPAGDEDGPDTEPPTPSGRRRL